VPNRNGVLLNIAASFAEARGAKSILFGSNREEAEAGFPDNTEDFRERINESLEFSTKNHVKVVAPVGKLYKRAIVAEGLRLGVPFDRIWSCYGPHEKHCGTCDSCKLLKKAIAEASAPSDLISFLQ
jgi:7-cyano-7-deazaguanine synthase